MNGKISKGRRNFLKTGIGSAAAIITGRKTWSRPLATAQKVINPEIDDLSVVCCKDPGMVTGNPLRWNTIADQNEFVVTEKVQRNMDGMAMALAQKSTPEEAWATIFQKPAHKQWNEVKVAIKANCKTRSGVPKNNPRLAVLDKTCKALNGLDIPFSNIIIYDGDDEEASALYAEYVGNGLPAGVIVSRRNDALGGQISTQVPAPWDRMVNCTADIANGTIDILVNCTVNKGSHAWTGPATISMKNHLGTFAPSHSFDFIVGINKSDAIVGGTPVRQQLVIVDSIWACTTGPSDPPNRAPHCLVMGTYSPVVDYLTIKKIREEIMGASHSASIVSRYLNDFGYSESDVSDFINVVPASVKDNNQIAGSGKRDRLIVSLPGSLTGKAAVSFDIKSNACPIFIHVHDISGRRIRTLPVLSSSAGNLNASWDGRNAFGARVASGMYVISVIQNNVRMSEKITLSK
jgi:hypothetical protein